MNNHSLSFVFKSLQELDFPVLFTWFNQEHIAQLWPEPKEWLEFEKKWKSQLTKNSRFIVYLDQIPLGYVHYYQVNVEDRKKFDQSTIPEPAVGLDLFIGETEYLNKGYGSKMVHVFLKYIRQHEPLCKAVIIDPAIDNHRAIACYEKVGFKRDAVYTVPYGTIDGPGPILLMVYEL